MPTAKSDLFTGWEMYAEKCKQELEVYMNRKQEATIVTTSASDADGEEQTNGVAPAATDKNKDGERYEYKFIVTTCDRNSLRSKYDRPMSAKPPVISVHRYTTKFNFTTAGYRHDAAAAAAAAASNVRPTVRPRAESEPRRVEDHKISAIKARVLQQRRESSPEPTFRRGVVSKFGGYQPQSDAEQPIVWQPVKVKNREYVPITATKLSKRQKRLAIQAMTKVQSDPSDWDEYLEIIAKEKLAALGADTRTTSNSVDPLAMMSETDEYTTSSTIEPITTLTLAMDADVEDSTTTVLSADQPLHSYVSSSSLNTLTTLMEEESVAADGGANTVLMASADHRSADSVEDNNIPFTESTDDDDEEADETEKSTYSSDYDEEEDGRLECGTDSTEKDITGAEGAFLLDDEVALIGDDVDGDYDEEPYKPARIRRLLDYEDMGTPV